VTGQFCVLSYLNANFKPIVSVPETWYIPRLLQIGFSKRFKENFYFCAHVDTLENAHHRPFLNEWNLLMYEPGG